MQALKLMSYGFGTVSGPSTSVNYWAYLTTLVGLFLEQIARATSEDSPTCETILNTGGQEATPVEGSG
ncbi:hypothetical protein a10_08864 [Streptomyces acidiscabies]|nr:hypothetical protein a10_08864 [Streptomyces acidiscabies]GAV45312.1 hypothetical protein Saa2_08300 [Streptomyces acidiscabies]